MGNLKVIGLVSLLTLPVILGAGNAEADVSTFLFGNHPKNCEKINPSGPDTDINIDVSIKNRVNNPNLKYVQCLAKQKDRIGSYWLGMFYLNGNGVEQNYKKAAKYLKRAARPDSGKESVYVPGVGGGSGFAMSFQARRRTDGLADARYQMALLHLEGLGVKKNEKYARQYLTLAARQGHQSAKDLLKKKFPETYESFMDEE